MARFFKRGRSYFIDYFEDGRRVRKALGRTRQEAERNAQQLGLPLEPHPRPRHRVFVRDLLARYMEHIEATGKPASVRTSRTAARPVEQHLGKLNAAQLRARHVDAFIKAELGRGMARETVNRSLRYLKASLRAGVTEGKLEKVPCEVKQLRVLRALPTILQPDEIARLFEAAEPRIRPVLMTAAMCGLRNSELRFLQIRDVDLEAGVIRITAKPGFSPKAHTEREVFMPPRLFEVLEKHVRDLVHREPDDWFFQRTPATGSKWETSALCAKVKEAFEAAGLYDRRIRPGLHCLRRSYASHSLGAGVDVQTVMETAGWNSLAVVQRYARSTDALKRRAAERLGQVIG